MKYNEAMKDEKCKQMYKKVKEVKEVKGKGIVDGVINVAKSKAKNYIKQKAKEKLHKVVNETVDSVIGKGKKSQKGKGLLKDIAKIGISTSAGMLGTASGGPVGGLAASTGARILADKIIGKGLKKQSGGALFP